MTADSQVLSSNSIFIEAWSYWARRSPRGGVKAPSPGVVATWMNHAWPICNLMFFDTPVKTEAELDARIQSVFSSASSLEHGWVLFVSPEMLPAALRERAGAIFKRHGLPNMEVMTGMATRTLAPPRRPLPQAELVRVHDARSRREVGTVNAMAYGIPLEWGVDAVEAASMWPESAFGYVARVGDKAVSTATVILLETCHYVGLVATLPEFQRHGHAEAVMRHAIAEAERVAGPKPVVLHATGAGRPVYRDMGFQDVDPFNGYFASEG